MGDKGDSGTPVRKRANLDHMTPEEKLIRRKLKNRVAAQNARDKKRLKMDDMEHRLKQLEDENKRILADNAKLLAMNKRLISENEQLANGRRVLPPTPPPEALAICDAAESISDEHDQSLVEQRPVESAELVNESQQKRQGLCSAGDRKVRNQTDLFWTCFMMTMAPAAFCLAAAGSMKPKATSEAHLAEPCPAIAECSKLPLKKRHNLNSRETLESTQVLLPT